MHPIISRTGDSFVTNRKTGGVPTLRIAMVLLTGLFSTAAFAEDVLIENVRIFNGVDHELMPGHVLVVDGIINTVS